MTKSLIRNIRFQFLVATAATSLLLGVYATPASAASTAQSWPGVPQPNAQLYSHRDNSFTVFRDAFCSTTSDPNSTPNIVTLNNSGTSQHVIANSTNGWKVNSCDRLRDNSIDGRFYYVQVNIQTYMSRVVATQNGNTLWTRELPHDGCGYPAPKDLAIGYDGNIYMTIAHTGCGSTPPTLKLTGLAHSSGQVRFQTNLPNANSLRMPGVHGEEILPYDNGIAVINNGANAYYFTHNGSLDSTKTFSPNVSSGSTIATAAINSTGRVYLAVNTSTARKIFYKDATSSTIHEIIPDVGGDYIINIHTSINNEVAFRWYKNSQYGISYYSANNTLNYSKSIQTDGSAYLAPGAQPWMAVDSTGSVITVRTMFSGSERIVYADRFSSAGTQARLFDSNTEYGTSTTDRFATSAFIPDSIGDQNINIIMCHTTGYSPNASCPSSENPRIVTIPNTGTYSYPKTQFYNALLNDIDGDQLTLSQELTQGSSDTLQDSDSDGLNDYLESTYFAARDNIFCSQTVTICEYPSPTQKDLYVEVDWMYKPATSGYSVDSYSMKPSTAQINLAKSAYAAKGINAHFDTGQLGGGNEVPFQQVLNFGSTANSPDFYNYKGGGDGITTNFDQSRYHTYRYMLIGYQYGEGVSSSGVSFAGDDDTFISYGLIKDTFEFDSFDTAIASTMIHELGHNLCLTDLNNGNAAYPDQPANCRFNGIDAYAGNDYPSAMNYSKQLYLVDYSIGTTGSSDHNDWGALRLQDFAMHDIGDPNPGVNNFNAKKIKKVKSKLMIGPSDKQLKEARSKAKR